MRKGAKDKTYKEVLAEVKALKEPAHPDRMTLEQEYAQLQEYNGFKGNYRLGKKIYLEEDDFKDAYRVGDASGLAYILGFAVFIICYFFGFYTIAKVSIVLTLILAGLRPAIYWCYGYFVFRQAKKRYLSLTNAKA